MCSAAAKAAGRFAKGCVAPQVKIVGRIANPPYEGSLRTILFLIAALVVLSVTSCQSVAPVIKIGLVAPFEGRQRAVGYDVLYSARLAVREINEAGGINGTRVALVALDDSGNPEFAQATARSLVIDPGVVAVVGHWLPETTAASEPVYEENGLLFLAGGREPFAAGDPGALPAEFVANYAAVTPFDEMPGPYAGAAYDAFQQLFDIFSQAQEEKGEITRSSVQEVISGAE